VSNVNLFSSAAVSVLPSPTFYMDVINSSKNAESSEIEKSVADTYHGPEGQVLIILVGLIGSGKVNKQLNLSLYI
jgi:hypothetical protein